MTDTDLIDRLESAMEPSRELDAEIAVRIKFRDYVFPGSVLNRKPSSWREAWDRLTNDGAPLPHYTSSIDDVRSLVPEGWQWEAREIPTDEGTSASAQVDWKPDGGVYAATPSLALCAAVLRARMS